MDDAASVVTTPTTPPSPLVPTITVQPASRAVVQGGTATLTAAAPADPTLLSYQWYFNGAAIDGATAATLTLTNVQAAAAGSYWVVGTVTLLAVDDANNIHIHTFSETSEQVVLSVVAGSPPQITLQPSSRMVSTGGAATFQVEAGGFPAPAYQWNLNGAPLSGATSASLNIANAQALNAGDYTVTVSNALGSVTSSAATQTVNSVSVGTTGGGSGGGGGAFSLWFCLALAALGGWRCRCGLGSRN